MQRESLLITETSFALFKCIGRTAVRRRMTLWSSVRQWRDAWLKLTAKTDWDYFNAACLRLSVMCLQRCLCCLRLLKWGFVLVDCCFVPVVLSVTLHWLCVICDSPLIWLNSFWQPLSTNSMLSWWWWWWWCHFLPVHGNLSFSDKMLYFFHFHEFCWIILMCFRR